MRTRRSRRCSASAEAVRALPFLRVGIEHAEPRHTSVAAVGVVDARVARGVAEISLDAAVRSARSERRRAEPFRPAVGVDAARSRLARADAMIRGRVGRARAAMRLKPQRPFLPFVQSASTLHCWGNPESGAPPSPAMPGKMGGRVGSHVIAEDRWTLGVRLPGSTGATAPQWMTTTARSETPSVMARVCMPALQQVVRQPNSQANHHSAVCQSVSRETTLPRRQHSGSHRV